MKFSQKVMKSTLSPIRKFHPYAVAAEEHGKKIYHLNIGQPDVETPPQYREALRNFDHTVLEYAPSPGIPVLIDAICGYYKKLGVDVSEKDVLVTTGGSEALLIAVCCLLDDDDEILVPEPFYPNYRTMVNVTGGKIHPIPTSPENGYFYADRALIESHINEHTRAMLISNPGNPTGTVLTHEQMEMLVDVAIEHDLFLICDEVYREFVYSGEPLSSFAQLGKGKDRMILVDSVSKRFSATGARIGCLISKNEEFIGHALKFCQARLSVATVDQLASAALYSVDEQYFKDVQAEYKRRRDTVVEALRKIPGVVFDCPQGAFYLMAALPVDDAEKLQLFLLQEFDDHGDTVMFAPGLNFYQTEGMGRNEIRIAYVLNCADCKRAIELLGLGIEAYNKKASLYGRTL